MTISIKCGSLLGFMFLLSISLMGQQRYITPIFKKVKSETRVYSDTLALDYYTAPKNTLTDKPLIILVHGGGFAGGKRNNVLEKKFCTAMAQRGFDVASISYHLTRKGKSFGCNCPTTEKLITFQKTTEDILKATHYLVENKKTLGFDPNKVILVGSSAGAEAVLNTVFMKNHNDFRPLPYNQHQFAGVISFAGALWNSDYITEKTAIPTLLFHGVLDRLVPYGTAPHHYCSEDKPGFVILNGSKTIADKLKNLGAPYTLYFDPKGNHDWANLAYAKTNEISQFIKTVILDGLKSQSEIKLSPNEP